MAAILDFDRNAFRYFWSARHPGASYLDPSQLVQKKKRKNRFSRWRPCPPPWIFDWNNYSYFWSTSHPMLPTKFQVNWLSVQEKKLKIDFQDGGPGRHLGFPIETICKTHPDASYQVSFQEQKQKNWFSRWRLSKIFDQNNCSYFWSTSHPNASYQVSSQLAFQFKQRS